MNPPLLFGLLALVGYVSGSIPFAVIFSKLNGVDIMSCGSGNPGATNVGRVLGAKWGILVFVCDGLKGLLPVLLARFLISGEPVFKGVENEVLWAVVGFAAVAGHIFSPFLKFKGGKGVATAVGAVFGFSPIIALICFGIFAIFFAITRFVSLASLIGVAASVPLALVLHEPLALVVLYAVASAGIVFRHRSNIKRLLKGQESKFSFKKREKMPETSRC